MPGRASGGGDATEAWPGQVHAHGGATGGVPGRAHVRGGGTGDVLGRAHVSGGGKEGVPGRACEREGCGASRKLGCPSLHPPRAIQCRVHDFSTALRAPHLSTARY